MTKKLVETLLVVLCFALIASNTANAAQSPRESTKKLIVQTAQKLGVDPYLALSIAKIESNFNSTATSSKGAIGMFQLTPNTAKDLGINPYNNKENIEGGIKYYQMLYNKFGSMDLALAAYNAGPGNVRKYNGIPPFGATKAFVKNIKSEYQTYKTDKAFISDTL